MSITLTAMPVRRQRPVLSKPVQWAEVDWKMTADTDSAQAAATRRRVIDAYADGETLVIGTHYAAPCAGHIVRGESGVWFRAKR